jgi:hypothetical protein
MITRPMPPKLEVVTRAGLPALLALALAACATSETQQVGEEPPVDLGQPGSVTGATGAAVPLVLCARSAALAHAVGVPPALLRLPAACTAAGRL